MARIQKIERKKGSVFKAEVRLAGHPYVSKTFAKLSEARAWAKRTEKAFRLSGEGKEVLSVEERVAGLEDEVERLKREVRQLKRALGVLQ